MAPSSGELTTGPSGGVPTGLPSHLAVGLPENNGGTWMSSSGVPWDMRNEYLTKGWSNNWGWGAQDGSYALTFMQQAAAQHAIPVLSWYEMNDEPGGGESAFLTKAQTAATAASYFADFKLLMQRARDFGKPVVVQLEPDGFGYMERQSQDNPSVYAAVAASGMPELSGLPNTVAGWGMAFLQLRKAVGASNVIFAVHISSWATGNEISTHSVTIDLQPVVNQTYAFLKPLGLGPNQTGATFDMLSGDTLDRDADYYVLYRGANPWWDASDTASIYTASFNRYAEWLRLWNVTSGKRWMIWQIPIGNSNHLNVTNNGAPRQGFRDNRPEYFFANGTAHIQKWVNNGVVALLFGAGATGQSSYQNDVYTDGQLFLKSRVGQFYAAGGVALPGAGGSPPPTGGSDSAQYNFEAGTQGWAGSGGMIAAVQTSATKVFAGSASLSATINATGSGTQSVAVSSPPVGPGKTVTFHVWIPTGSAVSSVQPYAMQGSAGGWAWSGNWQPVSALSAGSWTTLTVTVPANAAPLAQLGVQFSVSGPWAGTVYVDSVSY